VAIALGLRVRRATIVPGDGFVGYVRHSGRIGENVSYSLDRHRVERLLMVGMAGAAAERVHRKGHSFLGATTDIRNAADLASTVCPIPREMTAWLCYLWARTVSVLTEVTTWQSAEGIAAALLDKRTLSAAEVADVHLAAITADPAAAGERAEAAERLLRRATNPFRIVMEDVRGRRPGEQGGPSFF